MAKKKQNLILNITGCVSRKILFNQKNTYEIHTSNLKLKDELNSFFEAKKVYEEYQLLRNCSYVIRGGSSSSGCPMHHSITGKNPKKIYCGGKAKKRFFPRTVSEKIRVLDVLASPMAPES